MLTTSNGAIGRILALSVVLAMPLVLNSGCDKGWLAYQQIKLGRPLSEDHLLVGEGQARDRAKGWSEVAVSNMPLVLASDSVGVILDVEGNVMAKRYMASACAHWGLFLTLAGRSVMEVEVPARAFGKPPSTDSTTRKPPTTLGEYLKLLEDQMCLGYPQIPEDQLRPDSKYGTVMSYFTPPSFAIRCILPFVACDLGDVLDKSPGAMNQGYDLRLRDELGQCYRVRNMGGRRIRIEASSFRVADPCWLTLGILGPRRLTVDTGIDAKQTKTEIDSDKVNR